MRPTPPWLILAAVALAVATAAHGQGAAGAAQAKSRPAPTAPQKQSDQAQGPVAAAAPTPAPCSVGAIDALDHDLAADAPDPATLPTSKRQDAAERYDRRAAAYVACHDAGDAAATFAIALRLDPQDYAVVADKGQFDAAQGDWQDAVADDTAAIGLKDLAPLGVNTLAVYAARARSYDALKLYPQEIADLKQVVEHGGADPLHDALPQPPDVYKEALAKAYYRSGDADDAEALLLTVDESRMDWEDLAFLGQVRAQGAIWDSAVDALAKALALMPADPSLKARHAAIEVVLAKAYQARGQEGDARRASDAYAAALADDPDDADAKAGIAALGPMLTTPSFAEPSLGAVVMPAGVSDLDADSPPPFCSAAAKSGYLDTVTAAVATAQTNLTTLGATIDALLTTRASYESSGLLTDSEKIDDLALFDAEWRKLDAETTQLRAAKDALQRFFARIQGDAALVHAGTCTASAGPP